MQSGPSSYLAALAIIVGTTAPISLTIFIPVCISLIAIAILSILGAKFIRSKQLNAPHIPATLFSYFRPLSQQEFKDTLIQTGNEKWLVAENKWTWRHFCRHQSR